MITLKSYREYWEAMADRVEGLGSVEPLAVEAGMADKVNAVRDAEAPVLFYLPPSGQGSGSIDSFADDNLCVIFVMARYTPRVQTSFEVLEQVQPVVEAVKARLLADSALPCHFLQVDPTKISTIPEAELFGNWAGWSIAFTVKSD